jgi:predicted metal-dependent hydrolase
MDELRYFSAYPEDVRGRVSSLLQENRLGAYLLAKYPRAHDVRTDRALYDFTMEIRNRFLHKSQPLSRVIFDAGIKAHQDVLGLHSYIPRVHGSRIKTRNEIRISPVFKCAPVEFLRMVVVHELAHFREKEHNRAFYMLCQHMEPAYFHLELDMLLYLTYLETDKTLYS